MAHRVVCFGDACKLVLPEPMYPSRASYERSAPTPPPALIPVAEPCRNRTTRPPYSISRDPQARVSSKRAFRRSDRHGLCAQWLQGLSLTTCIPLFAFSVPENPEPSQREKRVSNDTLQETQRRVHRADSPLLSASRWCAIPAIHPAVCVTHISAVERCTTILPYPDHPFSPGR